MDIERQNCVDAFKQLGLDNPDSFFGDYGQQGVFKSIEDGTINIETFHKELHKVLPASVTDYQIDTAFQKFITGIPLRRLEALRKLRCEGYGIYVLSNTNPIMWRGVLANEFGKEGLRREDYFDGIVTSFEAKALKPDRAIFDYAVELLGIDPAETLFLDDSAENADAARALGFNAVVVEPGTEFSEYIPSK